MKFSIFLHKHNKPLTNGSPGLEYLGPLELFGLALLDDLLPIGLDLGDQMKC